VDAAIIRMFDPVNHQTLDQPDPGPGLDSVAGYDRRWVRCRRPTVTVGGELTMEALDLTYSLATGFYRAPMQLLANGGVLVIDDFGRQRCSPRELLNRWIHPLESRVDYLTLQSGQKIDVPFLVLPVFATNIKPAELVDEAFLRRIQYKVCAESPTQEEFVKIFRNVCEERGLEFDPATVQHLLDRVLAPRKIALRGCQPRDLINQTLALAQYLDEPRRLTTPLMEAACATYFIDEEQGVSANW
jgi:predicted ATPase with chaperone activity